MSARLPHRSPFLTLYMSVVMGVVGTLLQAQTPEPAEPTDLTAARTALFTQALADSQRITEQYITALAARETALAEAGDYEEARRFKQRRDQLTMTYAGFDATEARTVPLPLATARLMGSTQSSDETLTNWRSTGSGAEWSQFPLPPGSYILQFEANLVAAPVAFASARELPQRNASFEFMEVTQLLGTGDSRKTFTIPESPDSATFTSMRVGPLSFTRSPLTLRLTSSDGYPANVIRLRNLRFIPIEEPDKPALAESTPNKDTAESVESVRLALADELRQAQKVITQAHLDKLEALANRETSLKKLIEIEIRQIKRLTAKTNAAPPITPPTMLTDEAIRLEGLEEINDAVLADEEPLAGDRFTIVRDGKPVAMRLLWLRAPPVNDDDESAKAIATHFGIETEDAVAVGREARAFTASYLRGKKLKLLVMPGRDSEGALSALVFVPDVGLYQNVLVDQGLAAVQPPLTPPDDPAAKALLRSLTLRERDTRRHRPAVGAWAFVSDTSGK